MSQGSASTAQEVVQPLRHLEGLNAEQEEAVRHFEGPLLVLAGAGSGKTRVLTCRICDLVHRRGVAPDRILAVTFTNKAAGEMRERITRLLGAEPAGMWIGTFHALGARILRRHAPLLGWSHTFTIYDRDQSLRQTKKAQEAVDVSPSRWKPKAIRYQVSGAKNNLVGPQEFFEEHAESFDLFTRQVAKVYPEYQKSLKRQNAFDFDDLLVKPVELFQESEGILREYRDRFQFILVDEYQDTNHAQFRFLELLAAEHRNLMVVGDDDQSIYGWRGADIRNILDFEKTFAGARVVRLEQNYRSTERILDAANHVIRQNRSRKGKTLRTEREGGEAITVLEAADETDEARWIVDEIDRRLIDEAGPADRKHRHFAVLYRTNAQSRALEDAFRRRGMPYQIVGGVRFYERREIQDVLAYLRLVSNPRDTAAFDRAVNYPRRGIGSVTQERLARWADANGLSYLEAARRADEVDDLPTAGAKSLLRFAELIDHHADLASRLSVGELIEGLVEELDLLRELRSEGPDGEDRAENVKELVAGAEDFEAELLEDLEELPDEPFTDLDLFLQRVALVADIDRHDPQADAVTLMTLHNAKGLEFPYVFISGMEDGLFPLARAYDAPEDLEEERRLFYVGITRAEEKLFLTHARRRRRAGEYMYGRLSSFVEAIPSDLIDEVVSPRLADASSGGYGFRRRRGRGDAKGRGGGSGRRRSGAGADGVEAGLAGADSRDDRTDDEALNQDLPRLVKGERVVHPTFGAGTVREVVGSGREMKVVVHFDTVGRKKLLVRYAGLEKDF